MLRKQEVDVMADEMMMKYSERYLCRLLFVLHVVNEVRTNRMVL